MSAFTRFRLFVAVLAAFLVTSLFSAAADAGVAATSTPRYIVVGFVGGFVRRTNPNQGPVKLAAKARRDLPGGSYVHVFENRHRKAAYKAILRLLDRDHDGTLSREEKAQARIILFGHSWGASSVVLLARELDRLDIPVLLTVQVDSVAKPWQHDGVIPDNVEAAVNFYQPHGFIHGRSMIEAADASKTEILGNYRFDYHETPVKCEGKSWFDRTFTRDHVQSDCDPRIWSQVENLVRQYGEAEPGTVAAVPISRNFGNAMPATHRQKASEEMSRVKDSIAEQR
ncbi:MAG TPA: hypothetical protein VJQ59_02765 [Candidatus Sulfotelmatobacter sp.]|nr:hypothetical protein [Candidatus Sulfotelmatobacter sp.]